MPLLGTIFRNGRKLPCAGPHKGQTKTLGLPQRVMTALCPNCDHLRGSGDDLKPAIRKRLGKDPEKRICGLAPQAVGAVERCQCPGRSDLHVG